MKEHHAAAHLAHLENQLRWSMQDRNWSGVRTLDEASRNFLLLFKESCIFT